MYHVEMYSFGDVKIEGYYSVPKKAGKYPAIVYYMGYGANPYLPDADALPDFCEFVLSTREQGIQKASNTYGDWIVYGLENIDSYYYRGAYLFLISVLNVATPTICQQMYVEVRTSASLCEKKGIKKRRLDVPAAF